MSTHAKPVTPNRCYCRVQDEGVSLNEVAKLINALNQKILQLRNEVSDLNDIGPDGEQNRFEGTQPVSTHSSRSRDGEIHDLRDDVGPEKSTISEDSTVAASIHQNDSTNKNGIPKNLNPPNNDSESKLTLQTNRDPVVEIKPRRRIKKISHGVQCNLGMDRRRKRIFLNCFKTDFNFLKPYKNMRLSSDVHVGYDKEGVILTDVKRGDERRLRSIGYESDEEPPCEDADCTCHSIRIGPTRENFREDERQLFKYPTNRMGGGAEIRGNHLISDIHDKIQKINLYKNVKFDAKNVKKRLDACIDELNEIIEDVSLIFSK